MPFLPLPPFAPEALLPLLALACLALLCLVWLPRLASLFAMASLVLVVSVAPAQALWVGAGLMALVTLLARPRAQALATLICTGLGSAVVTIVLASAALHFDWPPALLGIAVVGVASALVIGFGQDSQQLVVAAYCCAGVASVGLNAFFLALPAVAAVMLAVLVGSVSTHLQQEGLT